MATKVMKPPVAGTVNPYQVMLETTLSVHNLAVDDEADGKKHKVAVPDRANHPATSLQAALVTGMPNVPDFLYEGIPVLRVTSNGTLKKRVITLSRDHQAVFVTHQKVTGSKKLVATVAKTLPIPLFTLSKGFAWTNQSKSKMLQESYIRYMDVSDMNYVTTGVVGSQLLEIAVSKNAGNPPKPEHMVTIFHHGFQLEPINLVIANKAHREALVAALQKMTAIYRTVQPWISQTALLLRYIWYDVDVDSSGHISKSEFVQICQRINLGDFNASKAFSEYVKKKKLVKKELQYVECMELLQEIRTNLMTKQKGSVAMVWETAFGANTSEITADQVLTFLKDTQGEKDATLQDAQRLIASLQQFDLDNKSRDASILLAPAPTVSDKTKLTRGLFEAYLLSKYNDAFDPTLSRAPDASYWDQPISKYWINTSHNTYLLGDQLASKSSVQAYAIALWRGCKCLELDCWDGDNKKDAVPVVFHGHTLTSKITFRSILLVVQNYLQAHPNTLPIVLAAWMPRPGPLSPTA